MEEIVTLSEHSLNCPVCRAPGEFFRSFGERRLYTCSSCASLFFVPLASPYPYGTSSSWQGCKLHVERYVNLAFHAEIITYIQQMIRKRTPLGGSHTAAVLEIGCSYGLFLDMARFLAGWKVVGIDPHLCARMGGVDLGLEIIAGIVQEAKIEEQFDVVIANQVIEHDQDVRSFLNPIPGLLKPGGFVLIITPDASIPDLGADYFPLAHTVLLSPRALSMLLTEAGLAHQHFFKFSFMNQMAVVAGKEPLADDFSIQPDSSAMQDWLRVTRIYLEARTHSKRLPASLSVGLNFRLFELLVNQGEYRQAAKVLSALEDSMGTNRPASRSEFVRRQVEQMTARTTLLAYGGAGPCCFAPYLYYKGMLHLNYTLDRAAALECFTYSQRLFEHEVETLGLLEFREWARLAKTHAGIARSRLDLGTAEQQGCNAAQSVCAPLFLKKGIDAFPLNLSLGKLKRLAVAGNESFVFQFTCAEDNFSGAAFDLLIPPPHKTSTIEITLGVFERFNPVELRKVTVVTDVGSLKAVRGGSRFLEPLIFDPIPDSRDKTYTLVILLGSRVGRALLLCTRSEGAVTIAWGRRYTQTQPVVIPYHVLSVPRRTGFSRETAPLVSCLLVTYNSEGHIRRCLDSIAGQNYPNIEVIVVDNHSGDSTVEIIREQYNHVTLRVLETNLHFCRGTNIGVPLCRGEFICVLNPDTMLDPGAVRQLVEHIVQSPHIAIVGSNIYTKLSLLRYADVFLIDGLIGSSEQHLKNYMFSAAPCGAGFLIRKSVIEEVGGLFDEGFVANWEDHDLGLRCWLHGYLCLHIPYLGVYHDGGGAYGLVNPRRDAPIVRNSLFTYFKNLSLSGFLKAFFKTVLHCNSHYKLWGLLQFLAGFWTYVPRRVALRKKRRIKDQLLKIITSGITAIVPVNESEAQPHETPIRPRDTIHD
jgi:GT2 family glycosyltransferase/SAM-dependent methyltransferase